MLDKSTPVWISLLLVLSVESTIDTCVYRNLGNLPPEIFSFWADWGCYIYTRPDLFAGEQLQASKCYEKYNKTRYEVPGLINEEKCVPFSHRNDFITTAAERTFREPGTLKRWIQCCQDAEMCCKSVIMQSEVKNGQYCPDVWDGWSCFPATPAGETHQLVCSQYAYTTQPPVCHHYSSKMCYSNGTWEDQTDYSACDITPRIIFRTVWHMVALSICIIICLPTILIMVFYPTLHTDKLSMVRTVLIVLVLRNFFVVIVKGTLILEELTSTVPTTMSENDWSCKMLSVLEKFFGTAVFTSMLLEGVYLHQMLTNVFRARLRGGLRTTELYIVGFLVTSAITLAWAVAMVLDDKKHCWQVTEGTDYHWIFDGPRLMMLVANFFLLVRIIWALYRTFNLRQEEHHPVFRTAKAALICLPLFGVPFFFLLIRPNTTDCRWEQAYYITYYTVEALQGVLIAVLHCYSEKEVKSKISGKIKRLKRNICDIYGQTGQLVSSNKSNKRRPVSEFSGSSTPRSSMQSRRESETSASTLATPQTDSNKERFSFPLPRIQEDDERNISSGSNPNGTIKHTVSSGNLSSTSSSKSRDPPSSRRHSADEIEADRSEESVQLGKHE